MSQRIWVNFKELRSKLRFGDVLAHYKVEVRTRGEQHHGPCPLPGHTGSRNGHTFSANLARGIFQCFGCKAKGNVLEFAALMQGVDVSDGDALRAVAVELQSRFFPEGTSSRPKPAPPETARPAPKDLPVVVNAPMDFELKGLEHGHESLKGRGFTVETMQYFGVGFCVRGMLKDKVAIPLHDGEGRLVGFAGERGLPQGEWEYLFPSRRERNGTIYAFDKTLLVYNAHRLKGPQDDLIVVQGIPSVWWLHQHGLSHAVALMGAECSEAQTEAIVSLVKPDGAVWLMTDGDEAGDALGRMLAGRLARRQFLRWARLGEGRRPEQLAAGELRECLSV